MDRARRGEEKRAAFVSLILEILMSEGKWWGGGGSRKLAISKKLNERATVGKEKEPQSRGTASS